MFFEKTLEIGDSPFLWTKVSENWVSTTGLEAYEQAANLAHALSSLGVSRGDRILLISESRSEWMIADIAIMAIGGISVPTYTTNLVRDHVHILQDSGAMGAIISGSKIANHFIEAALKENLQFIISMDPLNELPKELTFYSWSQMVESKSNKPPNLSTVSRTDTCCLIYTSGTGGAPKGVMLSHGSIISNCKGAYDLLLTLGLEDEIFLSFLPLSHSYEHTAGLIFPLSIKAQIYYAESIDKLALNMEEVQPTIMTAVPRLYETLHARILRGIERKGYLTKFLFQKTLEIGEKKYEGDKLSWFEKIINPFLTQIIRKKLQQRFGGRLKSMVSGGAPLNYDIGLFFKALDIELLQGYGQTEAAPIISCNLPLNNKIKTVGPPLSDVELKIAEDGEILVKGELVMQGYWNMPEETENAVKNEWLHTGDIGKIDLEGFLSITDRKKDIIVNSGGDNISPQKVEGFLNMQLEIDQSMVFGNGKPHLVALVVPNEQFIEEWKNKNKNTYTKEKLILEQTFIRAINSAVDRANDMLSIIEKVRRFCIATEQFTIENEMLTPSMKIRRHVILTKYNKALESLYKK